MENITCLFQKLISVSGLDKLTWESLAIYFGLTIFSLLLELLIVGKKNSSIYILFKGSKSSITDLFMWLVDAFALSQLFGLFLTFGICYYLVGLLQSSLHLNLIIQIPNAIIQTIIIVIIGDFKNYVRHFTFHKVSPLWRLHSFHHSAKEFTMLTNHRNHFVENAFGMFFDVIPFIIFGAPIETFFVVSALKHVHQMFTHSNVTSDWGIIGKYLFISPAAHRLHHSIKEEHYDKNLGSLLVWWDKLFGTWMEVKEVKTIGVNIQGYNEKNPLYDLWISYKGFFKKLFGKNYAD